MKKRLFLSSAVLLTACVIGVGHQLNKVSVKETPVVSKDAQARLVLPTIDGVNIVSNIENPKAGDLVTLSVSYNETQKRIGDITLNGVVLKGYSSSVNNTMLYDFVMPSGEATIEVEAVTLYQIKIDEKVQDKFALIGLDSVYAASGEEITFAPGSYAGYWFNGVSAVEDDVVLAPISDKSGWYSFTMPAHDVTLTSAVGTNIYQLTIDNNKITIGEGENATQKQIWSISGVSNKYYSFGDQLKFRTYNDTQQYKVSTVTFNGKEQVLEVGEENPNKGWYVTTMPARNSHIGVTYETWYRNISFDMTGLTNLSATIKRVVDGQEVNIEDGKVIAGDEIRVYMEDVTEEAASLQLSFAFAKASSADEKFADDTSTKTTYHAEGYYSFTVPSNEFIKVTITESAAPFKGQPISGTYGSGYYPYYSSNQTCSISLDGKFNDYSLTAVEGEENHYTYKPYSSSTTSYDLFFDGTDTLVNLFGTSDSSVKMFIKNDSQISLPTDDKTKTYSLCVATGSSYSKTLQKEFLKVTLQDGTVKTAYLDAINKTCIFGVEARLLKGVDGFTAGDLIGIYKNDTLIDAIKFTTIGKQSDGYRHYADAVAKDAVGGTYTQEGASNLVLNGYGLYTLGEESGVYEPFRTVYLLTPNEGTPHYVSIDTEAHTYETATDTFDGTYSGANGTLILDGHGAGTLNGENITYTISGNNIIIGDITYSLDKVNMTYAALIYHIDDSEYTYKMTEASGEYTTTNASKGSSSSGMNIYADKNLTLSLKYMVSSEAKWDIFFIDKYDSNGTVTHLLANADNKGKDGVSGEIEYTDFSVDLNIGEYVKIYYKKDSSGNNGSDLAKIKDISAVERVVTPTEPTTPDETTADYVGTWTGKVGTNTWTVVLNADGTGTINGDSITYTESNGTITTSKSDITLSYSNNTLHVEYDDGDYQASGDLAKAA